MKDFEKETQEQPSNTPQNPLTNDAGQQPETVFDEQLGGPIVNEPPVEGVTQPVEEVPQTVWPEAEGEESATDAHHAEKRVKKLKKKLKKAKEQFAKLKKSLKKAKGKKKTKKLRKKLKAAKAKRKALKKAMKEAKRLAA